MPSTPDAQGRHLADAEFFYVKAGPTAPTTATLPTQYTKVGLVRDNPFSMDRETTVVHDKDTGEWGSSLASNGSYTVDVEAHRKNVPDAGQVILRDAAKTGAVVYFLISSNVVGEETVSGAAIVKSYKRGSAQGEVATVSFSLEGQGEPAFTAVPAP